jgi:hypothetical protein
LLVDQVIAFFPRWRFASGPGIGRENFSPFRSVSMVIGLPSRSSMVCPTVGKTPTSSASTCGPFRCSGASLMENVIVAPRGWSSTASPVARGSTRLLSSPKELFFAPSRKTL